MDELRVLELFSGIGGMHYALNASNLKGKVRTSVEINPFANQTYVHNFPEVLNMNKNIQKLTKKMIKNMCVNTILMSPPCQPFTKNGLQKDLEDNRADPFKFICNLIKEDAMPSVEYILMENVKGFDKSNARDLFLETLKAAGFHYQEFIISPTILGVPNTRHRYYCIARKSSPFPFASQDILTTLVNNEDKSPISIKNIIEVDVSDDYLLPDNVLEKRFSVLAICTLDSINSMCFTKSYSRYMEGTGSVFCNLTDEDYQKRIIEINNNLEDLELKRSLKLRFFTPREISRLMSFPEEFNFPDSITTKQRCQLLGNSINVAVVGKLISLLKS